MTYRDACRLANEMAARLPPGWGWLALQDGEMVYVAICETSRGWALWLSKELADGQILAKAVVFGPGDSPGEIEARAHEALELVRERELRESARWN